MESVVADWDCVLISPWAPSALAPPTPSVAPPPAARLMGGRGVRRGAGCDGQRRGGNRLNRGGQGARADEIAPAHADHEGGSGRDRRQPACAPSGRQRDRIGHCGDARAEGR
ncbi:hypothetical protein GCM10022382_31820 [Microbacterium invictum]